MATNDSWAFRPDQLDSSRFAGSTSFAGYSVTERRTVETHPLTNEKIIRLAWRPSQFARHGLASPIIKKAASGSAFIHETPDAGAFPSGPSANSCFVDYVSGYIRLPDTDSAGTDWYEVEYYGIERIFHPRDFVVTRESPVNVPGTSGADQYDRCRIPVTDEDGILDESVVPLVNVEIPAQAALSGGFTLISTTDFSGSPQVRHYVYSSGGVSSIWETYNAVWGGATWSKDDTAKVSTLRVLGAAAETLMTRAAGAGTWATTSWYGTQSVVATPGASSVRTLSPSTGSTGGSATETVTATAASYSAAVGAVVGAVAASTTAARVSAAFDADNDAALTATSAGGALSLRSAGVEKVGLQADGDIYHAGNLTTDGSAGFGQGVTSTGALNHLGATDFTGAVTLGGTSQHVLDDDSTFQFETAQVRLRQYPVLGASLQDSYWTPDFTHGLTAATVNNSLILFPVTGLPVDAEITKVRVYCKQQTTEAQAQVDLKRVPPNAETAYTSGSNMETLASVPQTNPSGGQIQLDFPTHELLGGSPASYTVQADEMLYVQVTRKDNGSSGLSFSVYGIEVEYKVLLAVYQ